MADFVGIRMRMRRIPPELVDHPRLRCPERDPVAFTLLQPNEEPLLAVQRILAQLVPFLFWHASFPRAAGSHGAQPRKPWLR